MPAHIQFNDLAEWRVFANNHHEVLSKRRDWYFNLKTLRLIQ